MVFTTHRNCKFWGGLPHCHCFIHFWYSLPTVLEFFKYNDDHYSLLLFIDTFVNNSTCVHTTKVTKFGTFQQGMPCFGGLLALGIIPVIWPFRIICVCQIIRDFWPYDEQKLVMPTSCADGHAQIHAILEWKPARLCLHDPATELRIVGTQTATIHFKAELGNEAWRVMWRAACLPK